MIQRVVLAMRLTVHLPAMAQAFMFEGSQGGRTIPTSDSPSDPATNAASGHGGG